MHRAAYREARSIADCDELLEAVNLIALDAPIRKRARRIGQPSLRAGDAIRSRHCGKPRSELGVLIAYDHRVLNDAKLEGLPAWAPAPGT